MVREHPEGGHHCDFDDCTFVLGDDWLWPAEDEQDDHDCCGGHDCADERVGFSGVEKVDCEEGEGERSA